ncbi:MAG: hypothetical protein Hyperionvirus36_6 [Hyperionvirus sp.]|uniref:Uncharacterized protein n=1 Tax=Hyperionvirus sp. TaxID=2487770 RepID=A0A3G5AH52_9VIRU|nr:MAG: hypothetical protein Hyperionvirus36_6 [Hyperionvirus sp.]
MFVFIFLVIAFARDTIQNYAGWSIFGFCMINFFIFEAAKRKYNDKEDQSDMIQMAELKNNSNVIN